MKLSHILYKSNNLPESIWKLIKKIFIMTLINYIFFNATF